jgi:predicted alpha/beta hydrolase family esterase
VTAFLVVHGWQNHRPEGHWQRWLSDELRGLGQDVAYPAMPSPDEPDVDEWLDVLDRELAAMPRTGERVVVCHSLACLLWLHAAVAGRVLDPVDRLLLVAPPSPAVALSYPLIAAFAPPPVTAAQLAATTRRARLVASDDDPYCPGGAHVEYGSLGLDADVLAGAGHLDLEAGYGSWPSVLRWCLDPVTRLVPR